MIRPRPYLSYRQLALIEASEAQYSKVYFGNVNFKPNSNLKKGKEVADALETGEETGDIMTDFVISKMPKFEMMDVEFIVKLPSGIPILCKPDTYKKDYTAFKEYKTGVEAYEWYQKKVDESDQITFYAVGMYLKSGRLCEDIELCYAVTEYSDHGDILLTGEVRRFKTKRDMRQIYKMMARMSRAWRAIGELTEKELL